MSSTSSSPSGGTSSFFKTELEQALSEQSFGVIGYSMQSATAHDASATVTLLEQVHIIITLTIRGYQVGPTTGSEGPEFETLEALLQHYSPLYNSKRTELLVAKLSA